MKKLNNLEKAVQEAKRRKEDLEKLRIYIGYDDVAHIGRLGLLDELNMGRWRIVTTRRFDTQEEAQEFIAEIIVHPDVPDYIKTKLEPLIIPLEYNVDQYC